MLSASTLFTIESWTLYALGVGLILARFTSRFFTLGSVRRLQLDDFVMMFVIAPFTATVFTANEYFLSNATRSNITRGLKFRFALEELQITTNWLIKACLVILYRRIFPATTDIRERSLLVFISASCPISYVLIQILLPLWCSPESYWNPSSKNAQCLTYHSHSIFVLVLDMITIIGTFILPIAVIPTPRRFLQAALIILGATVVASSILSRASVLVHPSATKYIHWYIAELTLMLLFANLPFLSSLFATVTAARMPRRPFSLTSWPRSCKDPSSSVIQRPRNDSVTTAASTLPRPPLDIEVVIDRGTDDTLGMPLPISKYSTRGTNTPRKQSM